MRNDEQPDRLSPIARAHLAQARAELAAARERTAGRSETEAEEATE